MTPQTIRTETRNYVLRSLDPDDATESWRDWLAEPVAQRMLNTKPQRLTMAQVRDYIASYNRVTGHILGIFEKGSGRLVGIRSIYVDPIKKEYVLNVLVGESDARGKGARRETRYALHDFMFNTLGMMAGRCTVLAQNTPMIETITKNGWQFVHTTLKPSATGQDMLELRHYRLSRETWLASQVDRALREQSGE